jgi:O-antigen/teichoic acid export membrane protein
MTRNLLKNVGYLTLASQAANFFQFVFFVYFARSFGDEAVGKYAFAFSFTYVFSVLADLGVSVYLTCEIAKTPSNYKRLLAQGLLLRLFSLAALAVLGIVSVIAFLGALDTTSIYTIALLGMYQFFCGIADLFLAELKGHNKMGLVALLTMSVKALIAGTGILLILLGSNYLWAIACFPICGLLYAGGCLASSIVLFGRTGWILADFRIGPILKGALPFAFTLVFVEVLYNIDTLLLRVFADDHAVGSYSVAQRVVMIFPAMLSCIFTALLPTFSKLYVESKAKLSDLAGLNIRYLILAGLPISTGLFAISHKTLALLFGETFAAADGGMRILSWTVVLASAAIIPSLLLTASGRQKAKSVGIAVCLAANIGFNCLLIPRVGWEGAAWSRLIAEAMNLAIVGWMAAGLFHGVSWIKVVLKPAASCVVMYLLIAQFESVHLVWSIAIGIAAYVGCLGALQSLDKNEMDWIARGLRRIGSITGREKGPELPPVKKVRKNVA